MTAEVGSSFMARASEEQGAFGHFIEFVVHPPIPGKVCDEKRALTRPDRGDPRQAGDKCP
jgi:hypothetical protein